MLAENNILHLWGRGFAPVVNGAKPPRVLIDGVDTDVRPKVADDGKLVADVKVSPQLGYGQHRVDVVQDTPKGELRASATFIKAAIDNFEKR